MKKSLCKIPYSQAFILPDGQYRDCCSTTPQVIKRYKNFDDWWSGPEMSNLRENLLGDTLPEQCRRCEQGASAGQQTMRDVGERECSDDIKYPNRFQLGFSNICNIGCWSCWEDLSSVILEEKRKLKILPVDYVDPLIGFQDAWPSFKQAILKSYEENDTVLINIFGGEPTVSKEFVAFLELLVEKNLSHRTKIEMFTNCHGPKDHFQKILSENKWKHITILASIDAIGPANDWVRYGSTWNSVYDNFKKFKNLADYIELQVTLSVLNASLLPKLEEFCQTEGVNRTITLLQDPWFMSVANWNGDIEVLGNEKEFEDAGLIDTWNIFKSTEKSGSSQALVDYIKQFSNRTTDTSKFNSALHKVINF